MKYRQIDSTFEPSQEQCRVLELNDEVVLIAKPNYPESMIKIGCIGRIIKAVNSKFQVLFKPNNRTMGVVKVCEAHEIALKGELCQKIPSPQES